MTYLLFDAETESGRGGPLVRFGALCLAFGITAPAMVDSRGSATFAVSLNSINGLPDSVIFAWAQSFAVSVEVRNNHSRDSFPVHSAADISEGARMFAREVPEYV